MAYALTEALRAVRRSKLTALATVGSLTVFMFLLGLFLVFQANLSAVADGIRQRVQIEAFLDDGIGPQEAQELAAEISSLEPVEAVTYVDKDSALAVFQEHFGGETLQALDQNPLPASLKIELHREDRTFTRVEETARRVGQYAGVSEVEYGRRWLSRLDALLAAVRWTTLAVGLILAVCTVLLVATTIRLAFQARRRAVEIMQLVGADRGLITAPFLIEGALYGLTGGLLGIILMSLIVLAVSRFLTGLRFISPPMLLGLVILAMLLGALGSLLSLRRAGWR
jgi:cell division transport system permease protein